MPVSDPHFAAHDTRYAISDKRCADPLLIAEHLHREFADAPGDPLQALWDVSLAVWPGEFLSIVGPSGCGKSTLLRILGGLLRPTQGQVRFDGRPLNGPSREIGFLFQKVNLMPWRTVLRNIALPLEVQGVDRQAAVTRARHLIELVGLHGFGDHYPRQLSGGMQQRVVLARALIHEPTLLLLDEPFGALDAMTRERMNLELLRIWSLQRQTAVLVTHSIGEAVFLADRVLVMTPRPGRMAATIAVPLPRPRNLEMMAEEEFGLLTKQVRRAIEGDWMPGPPHVR